MRGRVYPRASRDRPRLHDPERLTVESPFDVVVGIGVVDCTSNVPNDRGQCECLLCVQNGSPAISRAMFRSSVPSAAEAIGTALTANLLGDELHFFTEERDFKSVLITGSLPTDQRFA